MIGELVHDDDSLIFAPEEDSAEAAWATGHVRSWKVLIADDDRDVHALTRMVLKEFRFAGRPLDFVSAFSAAETKSLLMRHSNIAVVLLDVVMETEDDGFDIVRFIRNELQNKAIRIILRTGQPGQAPEDEVVANYDINDYRSKTELTVQKLVTSMLSALRSYQDLKTLELHNDLAEARAAARARTEFMAVISHEVRTPMNGILGMARLLLSTPLTAEQREYAETVLTSGQSLLVFVNDILDFAKLEAGKLELESLSMDVLHVVEETVALMSAQAEEKRLALACMVSPEIPAGVIGDPTRLRQILTNLISNAIKFTERGSITVKVEQVPEPGTDILLRFSVCDTGAGVPADVRPRLFGDFAQAGASVARRHGGTGLGLAICRRLTGMMGGRIGFESEVGRGSTFWFTIRVQPETNPAMRPQPIMRVGSVLVAEPLPRIRALLIDQLAAWSMTASGAATANETLTALRQARDAGAPFDSVILSRRLTGMAAESLAYELIGEPGLSETGILILTAPNTATQPDHFALHMKEPWRERAFIQNIQILADPRRDQRHTIEESRPSEIPVIGRSCAVQSLNVLLVEDNLVNSRVIEGLLRKHGHRVTSVENGALAVEAFRASGYDLILMDRHMPVLDGITATTRIRALSTGRDVPIIALTAAVTAEDIEECLASGMNAFISKPVDPDLLFSEIDRLTAGDAQPQKIIEDGPLGETRDIVDFDPKVIHHLSENLGSAIVPTLLEDFTLTTAELGQIIAIAAGSNDLKSIESAAHGLKSSAGSLGLLRLQKLCEELELCCRRGESDRALGLASQMTDMVTLSTHTLENFIRGTIATSDDR